MSITDTGSNEFFIYKQHNIAAHATEELQTNAGIVIQQGEILKAQVNHANIHLVLVHVPWWSNRQPLLLSLRDGEVGRQRASPLRKYFNPGCVGMGLDLDLRVRPAAPAPAPTGNL